MTTRERILKNARLKSGACRAYLHMRVSDEEKEALRKTACGLKLNISQYLLSLHRCFKEKK